MEKEIYKKKLLVEKCKNWSFYFDFETDGLTGSVDWGIFNSAPDVVILTATAGVGKTMTPLYINRCYENVEIVDGTFEIQMHDIKTVKHFLNEK
jgi:hypothetical protein